MSKDALKKRVSHSLSPLHNTAGKSLKPIWFWWQESWNRYSALFKADLLQFFLKTQNEGLPLILHPLPTETNPEFQTAYILSLLAILPPSSSPSTPPFINLVPSRCLGLNSHEPQLAQSEDVRADGSCTPKQLEGTRFGNTALLPPHWGISDDKLQRSLSYHLTP